MPFIGGVYYFKHIRNNKLQLSFFFFSILIILTQVINTFITYTNGYNIWFFEISLIIEFGYFYWFFNKWNKFRNWFRILSSIIFISLLTLFFLRYFVYHTDEEVNYSFPIMIIYFVVQSSIMIISTFEKSDTEFNRTYIFWISFARLFYFMAILPFNIFAFIGNHLENEVKEVYNMADLSVNYVANIILNILFMYSFKCRN